MRKTSNLYQKTKEGIRDLSLAGLAALSLNSIGCDMTTPVERGVITKESFYPSESWVHADRYTAIVKLPNGKEVAIIELGDAARVVDLAYNVGDTVTLKEAGSNEYHVVDKKIPGRY